MIETFFQLILLFVFAIFILLPIYINLFKDSLFREWQNKLNKEEQLKNSNINRKKENDGKK